MAPHDINPARTIITITFFVIIGVVALAASGWNIGYRNDEGALLEGTLVDYQSTVLKRNHQAIAMVDGKLQAVSTWKISYVDKNGKVGRCNYVSLYASGGLHLLKNNHIKCYTGEIQFN